MPPRLFCGSIANETSYGLKCAHVYENKWGEKGLWVDG